MKYGYEPSCDHNWRVLWYAASISGKTQSCGAVADHRTFVGVGRATALAFSRAKWSLALFARRAEMLKETQALCEDPSNVHLVEGDVSKEADVVQLFRSTIDRFGMIFSSIPKSEEC